MLISGTPVPVVRDGFQLSGWLRAPLFLSEGASYFSIMETQPKRAGYVEVITTVIHQEHWCDLWRIEFETDDTPGNSALLNNLLSDRKLRIVNWESSRDTLSERHIVSVIVSATEYESNRDLTCRERMKSHAPRLLELEEDIAIYFWDQLSIDPYGQVRLKIRPLHFYRRLHDSVAEHRRFVMFGSARALRSGLIELSDRAKNIVTRTIKNTESGMIAYPTVDTKDRVIRTLIAPATKSSVVHFSASGPAADEKFIKWIYEELYRIGADILAAQIRTSAENTGGRRVLREQYFENSARIIDITFHIINHPDENINNIISKFRDRFEQKFATDSNISLRRLTW